MLGGFSMGTVMSYALGLGAERPSPAGILALSGFIPTVDGWQPDLLEHRASTFFIAHGRNDPVIGVDFRAGCTPCSSREPGWDVEYPRIGRRSHDRSSERPARDRLARCSRDPIKRVAEWPRSRVFGIVLAGGEGKRLLPLTADRAKPAVPFGGSYRLIDFVLSNLVNGRIRRIVVLTQYKSHSLDRHISTTWRLSALIGEVRHARAGADAPRAALVPGLRRRDLPEPEPGLRRAARVRLRVRRRSHLPDGPAPDGRPAHRDAARA